MNRRNFFVSASRYSAAGLFVASGGGWALASESKGHGEDKGHGEKPKDHGAKPAEKGHGEKPAESKGGGGHGEKPAAAADKGHGGGEAKPAAAHGNAPAKPAAPKPAPKVAEKPKPAPRSRVARTASPTQAGSSAAAKSAKEELRPATVEEIYAELKAGNKRFVTGKMRHPNMSGTRVRQTGREGEHPLAVVLCCADSRVAPELILDQGIGDLFTVRVAGNVANPGEVASVEYAVDHLRAPLVVVMGHSECATVRSVVDGTRMLGELGEWARNIKMALQRTRFAAPSLTGRPLMTAVTQMNVWESIEDMLKGSAALRDRLRAGELHIVGATYQVETGEVNWMGAHPDQCDFV